MTKIVFLTSGKINPKLPGLSLFESMKLTALGKKFPSLEKEAEEKILQKADELRDYPPTIIFSAPSSQAVETAKIIAKLLVLPVIVDERLSPLRFNLEDLLSEQEFNKLGDKAFGVLRYRFLTSFFEDKLLDKQQEFKDRFDSLFGDIDQKFSGVVLAVSHAYLIKLFEIYQQIGEKMFKEKKLLFSLFKPEQVTMGRLEEVELSIKQVIDKHYLTK